VKIRHRVLWIFSFLIFCQLISAGTLIYLLTSIDTNIRKEAQAKRIITLTDEISGIVGRHITLVSGAGLLSDTTTAEQLKKPRERLVEKTDELKSLMRGDKKMTATAERFQKNSLRQLDVWTEFAEAYSPNEKFYVAQFLDRAEMIESLKVLYDNVHADREAIVQQYGPIAKEFLPQALKERDDQRKMIVAVISLNCLIVLAVLVFAIRVSLGRLEILMSNIQKFSKGEKSLVTLSDGDELAELDKAFREMSEERNRLEEIRQAMRAMVNHDLRSPLTNINLRLDLIITKYGNDLEPDLLLQMVRMYGESQRLVRLASTLLDVEKLEEGKVELRLKQVTAVELVDESTKAVQSLAEQKEITIVENANPDVIVLCDVDRTIQVVVNFLSNAIKFAPEKSTVEVTADRGAPGTVKVSVLDEGPGVPADKISSLFSKFQQFDQPIETQQQGSGLGLYICKMLIETQDGKIGYTPREPHGSAFWFELKDADQVD
jgi:signal transduction histidine kinase